MLAARDGGVMMAVASRSASWRAPWRRGGVMAASWRRRGGGSHSKRDFCSLCTCRGLNAARRGARRTMMIDVDQLNRCVWDGGVCCGG